MQNHNNRKLLFHPNTNTSQQQAKRRAYHPSFFSLYALPQSVIKTISCRHRLRFRLQHWLELRRSVQIP
jgi:hypothetical protein